MPRPARRTGLPVAAVKGSRRRGASMAPPDPPRWRSTGKSPTTTISGEPERSLDSCYRKPAQLPDVR